MGPSSGVVAPHHTSKCLIGVDTPDKDRNLIVEVGYVYARFLEVLLYSKSLRLL